MSKVEILKCKRCGNELNAETEFDEERPVAVDFGNTHIMICYPCAVELTLLIGHWLGTEPMDDLMDVVERFPPNEFFEKLAEHFEGSIWWAHSEGALEGEEFEEAQAISEVLQKIVERMG